MELLSVLGINWQLLLAQIVNFTILMVVLLYFVYRPILRLVDKRRDTIKQSMENAKDIELQKRELEQFKIDQMRKADVEMQKLLEEGRKQAEVLKRDILEKAQHEAGHLMEKTRQTIEAERKKMLIEAQSSLAAFVVKLSQKLLEREFSDQDQQRMLKTVEKDLPALLR
ncbi:MAG: F-type H+-transporting ATPase subunit b [Candidatus Peregrinibacteria bacterium Gr01-1014_25]|nr:MAG: F-type H+-transporting ATPase subunit b [Candidatus Peregrinibacteria bacterium Gr01-1014_25]